MANSTIHEQLTLSKCISYIILASQIFIVLPEFLDICISLSLKIDSVSNKKRIFDGLFCQVNEIRIVALFGHLHLINALKQLVGLRLYNIKMLIISITLLIIKLRYKAITSQPTATNTQTISCASSITYLNHVTLITIMAETCHSILPFI